MDGKKPSAAFVLTLIGGILVLLYSIVLTIVGTALVSLVSRSMSGYGSIYGIIGILIGLIIIVSAIMLNSTDKTKIRNWSIVALIFSIISLVFGGGFIIGFVLGLIGSILGLTYKG